jgi:chorismate dehydratase
MLHGPQRGVFDLDFRLPSECADALASGDADIGIVPVIEMARQRLEMIPGTGIACRGAVRSILLLTKEFPEKIRTVAVDTSSRTSVMLARVILAERYGVEPRFIPHPPQLGPMLQVADAALIIGDPALRLRPELLSLSAFDLGAEWMDMTGLPFVFAVWAGRKEVLSPELEPIFSGSCRFGLEHLEEIAQSEAGPRNMTPQVIRDYFTHNVVLELGEKEYEGMRMFLRRAARFDMLVSTGGATT